MAPSVRRLASCWLVGIGCAPSLEVPKSQEVNAVDVWPPLAAGVTSRSVRITTQSDAEVPRLFEGKLSERQVTSLRRGEVSNALIERELELVSVPFGDEDAPHSRRVTWLPTRLLRAGAEYSVVAGRSRIDFKTLGDEPSLTRVWPETTFTSQAVFCLESPLSHEPLGDARGFVEGSAVTFGEERDGGSSEQEWVRLRHSPPCWFWRCVPNHVDAGDATDSSERSCGGETSVPYLTGFAVQPTWPATPAPSQPAAPVCTTEEMRIGGSCARVEDDRVVMRGGETSTFWTVEGDAEAWFILGQGRTGVVSGLRPSQRQALTFAQYDPGSYATVHIVAVETTAPRPHVVINEVMADPVGREPNQEWVELYNDGLVAVNLEGWSLMDEGGEMKLPEFWLAPSGYALLVNDTYVANAPGEPVPDPNVSLLRLPVLAKSGLSNSGETLRLKDKSDMVVTSFPSTPKPTAGVSVARGAPWQVDEPTAFGRHAVPGASPGGPNRLRASVDVR